MKHECRVCKKRHGAMKLHRSVCRKCRIEQRIGYTPRSSKEQDKILEELKVDEEGELEKDFRTYMEMLKRGIKDE